MHTPHPDRSSAQAGPVELLPLPVLGHQDLELAARDAEVRARALREEAEAATTHWARQSIMREALEHVERARRYRRAARLAPSEPTAQDARAALEVLCEYLLNGHECSASDEVRVGVYQLRLELAGIIRFRDVA